MTGETILAIAAIVFFFAAVLLFFLGLSSCIKSMRVGGEEGSGDSALSKSLFKRSISLCSLAVVAYIFFCICTSYPTMTKEGADLLTVVLQSLWQGIKNTGFLILLPIVLRKWRNPRRG